MIADETNFARRLQWTREWSERLGKPPESERYLRAVEAWRNAWRPERVKLLLVAESHVREAPGDAEVTVKFPASMQHGSSLPSPYVRLIYCLGYGQVSRCFPHPVQPTKGTPGFWRLFGQIARGEDKSPGRGDAARLAWRLDVLQRLKARGIWLEDASPLGVYVPSRDGIRERVTKDDRLLAALLREGFEQQVWPGVAADEPKAIWVIGKAVAGALRGLPQIRPDQWIYQPEALRTDEIKATFAEQFARLLKQAALLAPED